YQHETSNDADGQPMAWFVQSGAFMLQEGTNSIFTDWFIPDMRYGLYENSQSAQVQVTIKAFNYPNIAPTAKGPFTVNSSSTFISTRVRSREISVRYSGSDLGSFVRSGNMRFRTSQDGRR